MRDWNKALKILEDFCGDSDFHSTYERLKQRSPKTGVVHIHTHFHSTYERLKQSNIANAPPKPIHFHSTYERLKLIKI